MAAGFVAAIDHGTTSTRCMLFDRTARPVATAQRAQTMHYPQPGWVELDMDEVWRVTQECIHEALGSAGASPADVAGIGITNERETAVLWDRRTGRPVARSITWQDTRTAAAADALAADGGIHRFQHRTGLPISTASTALKLRWLLDQDPARREAAGRGDLLFGQPDSWLLWNLTGGPAGGVPRHRHSPVRRSAGSWPTDRTAPGARVFLSASRVKPRPRRRTQATRAGSDSVKRLGCTSR
jgi:glycerol kinase